MKPEKTRMSAEWFRKPVIPVIWQLQHVETLADASLVFLQGCELSDLAGILATMRSGAMAGTPIMVHVDLLGGLSSDDAGLRYLAGMGGIDGIITVRPHLVGVARRLGLSSILLLFLQDGRAVERGLHITEQARPDAIELVPGVAALETAAQFDQLKVPRIGGGLVRTPDLVRRLLASGCCAVSTSNQSLWSINREKPPGPLRRKP